MYGGPRTTSASRLGEPTGIVSLLMLAAAGPLHRFGVVGLAGAFGVLKWAVYGALAALVLSIAGVIVAARRRTGKSAAMTGLVASLIAIGAVGALAWKASRVP